MSYSTATSILTILPGLPATTSADGYSSTVSLIESHIVRADSFIDAKCSRRYSLPFSPVPPFIRTISEDISSWFVYRSEFSTDIKTDFENRFEDAVEWLNQIQAGELNLVDTSGSLVAELSTTSAGFLDSNTKDYQPFFDEDEPVSWKIDADKKDGIADNR